MDLNQRGRILILTAGFGEGHNAAARNLAAALTVRGVEVRVEDVFALAYGPANSVAQEGYKMVINRLPGVWQWAFAALDRSSVVSGGIGIFGRAGRKLTELIQTWKPTAVVTTYPGYNHLLDFLVRRGKLQRSQPTFTVVTDSITINSVWYRCHSDWFLLTNEQTESVMVNAGVPKEKLKVTGFPVPEFFARQADQKSPPSEGERWRVLYMINSGRQFAPEICRRLLALPEIELTVTAGRDAALKKRLEREFVGLDRRVKVLGWEPEIPSIMARSHVLISKAGGATVQEALAAATPMIVTQVVPGQEEGNAMLIEQTGAGCLALTPAAIEAAVRQMVTDGGRQWESWYQAARQTGRPNASVVAADSIAEVCGVQAL